MKLVEPTPVGKKRAGKEPELKARYKCLFCGSLMWPAHFKKDIPNITIKAFKSDGYKNIHYMNANISNEMYISIRKAIIKRCFDILKKLGVTKFEILSEFGMKDIADEQRLMSLLPIYEEIKSSIIELKPNVSIEVLRR